MPGPQATRSSGSATDSSIPSWAAKLQQDLTSLNDKIDKNNSNLEDKITKLLQPLSTENSTFRDSVKDLIEKVCGHQFQLNHLRSKCKSTTDRLLRLESYSMRENLIFTGIVDHPGESEESLEDKLMNIFDDELSLDISSINIVRCHRLHYKHKQTGNKDVIVRFSFFRFSSQANKNAILHAARKFKGRKEPLFINEQFPKEVDQQRIILRPALKMAKDLKEKASLVQNKLIMRGVPTPYIISARFPLTRHNLAPLQQMLTFSSAVGTHPTVIYILFRNCSK